MSAKESPGISPRSLESGGYLSPRSVVPLIGKSGLRLEGHMLRSYSLLTPQCSTIGDAVSRPSPLRCLRSLLRSPRAAGAHTAARPAPLMHFSQPNDHPSLMGIAKECVNARPWGPQNISNFWGERRHELLLRFSGVVSSSQSRCRPRHLWSL